MNPTLAKLLLEITKKSISNWGLFTELGIWLEIPIHVLDSLREDTVKRGPAAGALQLLLNYWNRAEPKGKLERLRLALVQMELEGVFSRACEKYGF